MKALVTGATGFVGGAVVRALVKGGLDVRVLARAGADLQNIQLLLVERIEGDLRDQASLRNALAGCRQLYHVASHYALWAKDPSVFNDINVTGTKNLLEAARDVGAERIVHCTPSVRSASRQAEDSARNRHPSRSTRWPATTNGQSTWPSKRLSCLRKQGCRSSS
ncbi:MAG: NAD-dependent epimerase/dehydratase family protein [Nitrospirota bacterium]